MFGLLLVFFLDHTRWVLLVQSSFYLSIHQEFVDLRMESSCLQFYNSRVLKASQKDANERIVFKQKLFEWATALIQDGLVGS